MPRPPDLTDRVAIITGAGKGLGRAYAQHLAARGAAIVVNNRRHPGEADDATSAARVVATIRAAGGRAVANYAAVERPESGANMVTQALEAFGRLDIVIANAALAQLAPFHKLSLDQFRTIFDVSILGSLHLVHAAWPVLRGQRSGRVILTTSSAGRFGNHGLTAYAAAKGAVEMLMRSLAAEGAANGIYTNAISPYARSQMTEAHLDPALAARLAPEAVAPMVAWLASDDCTVNGEVIVAAGGRYRRAYAVETAGMAGTDLAGVIGALRTLTGVPHASATAAFASVVAELTEAGR